MNSVTVTKFTIYSIFILALLSLFAVFNKSVILDQDNRFDEEAITSGKIATTYSASKIEDEDSYFVGYPIEDEQTAENCREQNVSESSYSESLIHSESPAAGDVNEEKNIKKLRNSFMTDSPQHDPYIGYGIMNFFPSCNNDSSQFIPVSRNPNQIEVTESVIANNQISINNLTITDNSSEFPLYETFILPPKVEDTPDVSESGTTENTPVPEPIYPDYVSTTPPQLPPLEVESGEFEAAQIVSPAPLVATNVGFLQEGIHHMEKEAVLFPEVEEETSEAPVVHDPNIFGSFPFDEETAMYEVVPEPHFGLREPVRLPNPEDTSESRQRLLSNNNMTDFPPVE